MLRALKRHSPLFPVTALTLSIVLTAPYRGHAQLVGTARSTDRVAAVRLLIKAELAANPKASDLRVSRNALSEFAKSDDCTKRPALDVRTEEECRESAQRLTDELVAKKYPAPDKAALEKEAAEKFPVYVEGQKITVVYRSPAMDRKLTGIYRGRQGQFVVIGSQRVMMRDIERVPANKDILLMFDSPQSMKLRTQYVEETMTRHKMERKAFSRSVKSAALKMQKGRAAKENEENGYVFYESEWRSLREMAKVIISEEREKVGQLQPAE
ncbi:MAG: hypothetical protein HN742_36675 [Lentisphaerae bacterium]|jgi:hypothetical protein|nr:hypothetical protein [Lentisphaerota bacterium]MBT4817231.1 hypothetical protein [Lentisphaerota bacterium]MBT5604358.1 hypothetical protein [Lentisphaerota bacterium]MBT7053443.1 hypothetical protein [Lentisphaerota bacterium]MBT7847461.1 hypothetical protein [Lentisphaerota bacterium]